jgi:hypothetical protein
VKGYHYVAWLPALVGLVWYRRRFWEVPGAGVLAVLVLLDLAVLWRVAYVVGYVAERHALPAILCSSFWAVAAVLAFGDWVAAVIGRWSAQPATKIWTRGPVWSVALLLALAVSGLPKTLEPLHTNRAGFHAAGLWLAEHVQPDEQILDPFCWVEYYAGQVHQQVVCPTPPKRPRYVVLGGTDKEHERLPAIPIARFFATHGELVFRWPTQPAGSRANKVEEVLVYEVQPFATP